MAKYHIRGVNRQGKLKVLMHIPLPDERNEMGVTLQEAIVECNEAQSEMVYSLTERELAEIKEAKVFELRLMVSRVTLLSFGGDREMLVEHIEKLYPIREADGLARLRGIFKWTQKTETTPNEPPNLH